MFLKLLLILITAASVLYLNKRLRVAAYSVFLLYVLLTLSYIIYEYVQSGYVPFSNIGETLVFLMLFVSAVSLYIIRKNKDSVFCVFSSFFILIINIAAVCLQKSSVMFPAILNTGWFYAHVLVSMIAYSFLCAAFLISSVYFFQKTELPQFNFIYKCAMFLYFLLMITGSVWAQDAWGFYWSWDPKETAALAAFLIYMCGVHSDGRAKHFFSIFGFIALIFCYMGVTFLMKGLHSY